MSFPDAYKQWRDSGAPVPNDIRAASVASRSVPVETPGPHDLLAGIRDELAEQNALLRMLLERGGASTSSAARSSVELEDLASGKTRVTTKIYDGSPIGSVGDEALAEHGRIRRRLEERVMNNWAETVAALKDSAGK